MSLPVHDHRAPALKPTVTGWRSDDGYCFTLSRGSYSKRMLSTLVTPDGEIHRRAGTKSSTAADLLAWAEADIRDHRRSGSIR